MKPLETILVDGGEGVTEKSKSFFTQYKDRLGEVRAVACLNSGHTSAYNTIILGTDAIMLLSGFNCGYGGEGPHGLLWLLENGLRLEDIRIEIIALQDWFTWTSVNSVKKEETRMSPLLPVLPCKSCGYPERFTHYEDCAFWPKPRDQVVLDNIKFVPRPNTVNRREPR